MSKIKDELRTEYRREDLGKGVRGKYFARVSKGTNLVLLDDKSIRDQAEVTRFSRFIKSK